MNDEKIAENLCSAYSKLKIDDNFISKTKEKILLQDDIQYCTNETEQTSADSTLNIKQKFIFKRRFILNAIASVLIIAILLNVAFFKGAFNKKVIPISPVPSNSSVIKATNTPIDTGINGKVIATGIKSYGGSGDDQFYHITSTSDGGYVVAGNSTSTDGDLIDKKGVGDAIMAKFDKDGNKLWLKNYECGVLNSVIQTNDGGYVAVSGATIIKFDKDGNLLWKNNCSAVGGAGLYSVVQTSDGGYIAAGGLVPSIEDSAKDKRGEDALVVKFNVDGNTLWWKNYGGHGQDRFNCIILNNKGYVAVGCSTSTDGDFKGDKNLSDAIIINIDNEGNIIWVNSFGKDESPEFLSVAQTKDGDFITVGKARPGYYDSHLRLSPEAIIAKFDRNGNKIWANNYIKSNLTVFSSIIQTSDGENIVLGVAIEVKSFDFRPFIYKFDNNGNKIWLKYLPDFPNSPLSVIQTNNGGYVAAGTNADSSNFDTYIFTFNSSGDLE